MALRTFHHFCLQAGDLFTCTGIGYRTPVLVQILRAKIRAKTNATPTLVILTRLSDSTHQNCESVESSPRCYYLE
jgi:hypothetical protein